MRIARFAMLVSLAALVAGCGTTPVSLKYQPARDVVVSAGVAMPVVVGRFADQRGRDPRRVGTIRGGYGNVLKELRTEETTSQVVEAAFADALRARNLLAADGAGRLALEGAILKLDCNYFMNREAHVHLLVNLVSLPSRAVVYSQTYRADLREDGVGAGIFADVNYLAEFAQRALTQAIDHSLSDRSFLDVLAAAPN